MSKSRREMREDRPASSSANSQSAAASPTQPSSAPVYVSLLVAFLALIGTVWTGYMQSVATRETADLNFRAAQRSSDIKMGEIAVSILRAPVSEDVASIRGWAMDVIDNGNTRKFTKEERAALLKKPLPAVVVPDPGLWISRVPDVCTKFKKDPDGVWRQSAPLDVPNARGLHIEGIGFKGGMEAAYLDSICTSK